MGDFNWPLKNGPSAGIQEQLDGKQDLSEKGQPDGYAALDSGGRVPSAQLPSYVDDVLEYADVASFPVTGSAGVIYVALDTDLIYRWTGSGYLEISESLNLGETSTTAYRGDRGKTAYDHSQLITGNPHAVTKTDVGLGNVDNTSDVNKPISDATQAALNGKAATSHNHTGVYEPANANIQTHISNTSNPHSVTKAQVGLGNVDNTSDLDKPISTATQAALNALSSGGGSTITRLTADVTSTTVTSINLNGLSVSVENGGVYEVYLNLIYDTAVTTTGIVVAFDGGTATVSSAVGMVVANSTATAQISHVMNALSNTNALGTSGGAVQRLVNAIMIIECNGSGTIIPTFHSEVAASACNVRTNSFIRLTRIN